jgi:hypothetical protein
MYYHRKCQIDATYHDPFSDGCFEEAEIDTWQKPKYSYKEPWYQRDSADGKNVVTASHIDFKGMGHLGHTVSQFCSLQTYYVNLDTKERTWDCPCLKCCARGQFPQIETCLEEPPESLDQERSQDTQAAATQAPLTTQAYSDSYRNDYKYSYICSRCLRSDQYPKKGTKQKPKKLDHWLPRSIDQCKIVLSQIGNHLVSKIQTHDNDYTSYWEREKNISAQDALVAIVGLCLSIFLVRLFEGLRVFRAIYDMIWDGSGLRSREEVWRVKVMVMAGIFFTIVLACNWRQAFLELLMQCL